MSYEEQLTRVRISKDGFFKSSDHSPLTPHQREVFHNLDYYEPNKDLKFIVELKLFNQQERVNIVTSKGNVQEYIKHGYVEFEVDSQKCMLTVFKDTDSDYFFVPFKDKTTGKETYDAGRYVELEKVNKNEYELDFNAAYNPYCAYNENWVCPLTPFENTLSVEILAGERKFEEH
ncbi:MAG: DUF1684 domain-containing protein [Candidatus Heimdallarchaeaceae archaeon]|jgi:uncharacterized protein (DUF1684 family)